jgi:hypothetical protein
MHLTRLAALNARVDLSGWNARSRRILGLEVYCGCMSYENLSEVAPSTGGRRTLAIATVVLLIAAAGAGSYFLGHRDSSASRARADLRGAQLAQVQDQLRSAAKQNDYLAQQVRQGTRALTNAGSDSQNAEQRLRAALRRERKVAGRMKAKQQRTAAKLHGLSSGLKGSLGAVSYVPPASNGGAGSIQGSMTITNSAGTALDAVCVLNVGSVRYAIMSTGVPSKGSVVESFHFPYAGPQPSGATSGGCGRL